MGGKKKFSFVSVILSVICVVFVCEAAVPAAAIGNQQFFWRIFLIITFLLPYGMVAAELGTAYDENVEYSAKAELHAALDALEQL